MRIPGWLKLVLKTAPLVLGATPLAPLIPWIIQGIQTAEKIQGATGPEKLAIAKAIAAVGVSATNAQAGKVVINPAAADSLVTSAINAVVAATNLKQKDPSATVAQVSVNLIK